MSITLFSNKYPKFSPNYTSQGRQDNCWLISTLIALSTQDKGREILKKLFIINQDNTYTIKLFNDVKKPFYINVVPEFKLNVPNELMYCGNGLGIPKLFTLSPDSEYIWSAIIEKSIMEFIGNIQKCYSYNAFSYLTDNEIHKIYSYGLNKRTLSKIKELKNICCTVETNDKTIKLQKNHAYIFKSIKNDIWYLHNPHYTINDSKGCISINENELIYNIDIITYIIL